MREKCAVKKEFKSVKGEKVILELKFTGSEEKIYI